jgi:alkylation response protein AidB-like acyl-CoA dehydrogenase
MRRLTHTDGLTEQRLLPGDDGIEVGRVNVAARGCGVANRAFELAVAYARQRKSFGKIIGEHQAITFKLAETATKVTAATR